MGLKQILARLVAFLAVLAGIGLAGTALAAMAGDGVRGAGVRAKSSGLPAQTRAQAQARIEAYFLRLDGNRDGVLTADEYARESDRRMERRTARLKARGVDAPARSANAANNGKRLDRSDGNGDGKVTRAELVSAALARFDRNDADRNGVVTPEERRTKRSYRRRG